MRLYATLMPRRRLVGLPTTSSAPYCDRREGTRFSLTLTTRWAPLESVKLDEPTATLRSRRERLAATSPLRAWRHGRVRTVMRSRRPVEFVIVTVPAAPRRAVVSRIEGVTCSPACCAAVARGADGASAKASCVAARPATAAAPKASLRRYIKQTLLCSWGVGRQRDQQGLRIGAARAL